MESVEEDSAAATYDRLSPASQRQVGINAVKLFEDMNAVGQATYRSELIWRLTDGMEANAAATVTGKPADTVRKARRDGKHTLFQAKATKGDARAKRTRPIEEAARQADAVAFIKERFGATQSGDKREVQAVRLSYAFADAAEQVYRSTFTREGSFNQYAKAGGTAGRALFFATFDELHVKQAKHGLHDFFSCTLCAPNGKHVEQLKVELTSERAMLDDMQQGDVHDVQALKVLQIGASIATIQVSCGVCHPI